MTPKKARYVLHNVACLIHRNGRSALEFQDIIDYSPWTLGEEFNEAVGIAYNDIEHIIALVWSEDCPIRPWY